MSGGLAEGSGSSHSSSNRRNDGPGFKTTTATRRIGETRKRGRKGSQSHRHQQHQQNRRDQNAPVNQHRRDTSPVGSSHLSGEQLPDRSERLMMIEGITRPTTEMAIQGCDAGLSAPPYNICPTVGPVLGTECDGFRITSTKTSKVAVASSLSPSPMPNIPKYQKAERTHTHADFCEQYTTRAIRNRSTQVQGPQDLTTEDASGTPDDTSTTADDASQVSSRSESSTTVVDRSEQEEINVSINELASAVSQISFKANIHAGELSVMSNRSLSDEDNQSDQAGFPSWHSSPVDHPEGYSAQLAPSLQGNMRDHQQPLVKASSGHPSVDHIDHHQKDKDLKRISEQRSQIQVNGSGSQRQQGQKHSVSSNHRRSNAHRQGQERHHRSSNPSSALQASSTTRQKAVAPSLSDETLFPPMKATLVSNVARTSTSTQFSRGFSYASALKQPVQSETPSSESV
ncbi:hypothetical protein BGW41_004248 [Actinomortierella wolfii]|nr:hypothetical protein BGW41_004248 [Actinomortierella wolfii]